MTTKLKKSKKSLRITLRSVWLTPLSPLITILRDSKADNFQSIKAIKAIEARSTPASLSFKGHVTKHTTVTIRKDLID